MPTPLDDQPGTEEVKRLLATTPVIRNACDLDLLIFLHRHPRTLLTSEQVAGFVGHNLNEVAKALETFIDAGLVARMAQHSMHAARLYLLLLDGPQGRGLSGLLELARTREGRLAVLSGLNGGESRRGRTGPAPELRLIKCA